MTEIEKKIRDKLKEYVGNAYEVGHAHGRRDLKWMNIGWLKYAKKIETLFQAERERHEKVLDARRDALHKTLKVSKNETEKLMLMAHINEISNIEEELKLVKR